MWNKNVSEDQLTQSRSAAPTVPPTGVGCPFNQMIDFRIFLIDVLWWFRSFLCRCRRFSRLSVSRHCMDQIQPKMLTKHVFRLVEKFNVDRGAYVTGLLVTSHGLTERVKWVWPHVFDAGLCPNALHKRRLDTLRFLMYSRFIEVRVVSLYLSFNWHIFEFQFLKCMKTQTAETPSVG